jgi:flagellar biosynthesis protein FlhF
MNIKKFIAKNSQEAMQMVKKDMGTEAVILKTRTINSGSGYNKRSQRMIEVTAAVDYRAPIVTTSGQGSYQSPTGIGLERLEKDIREIKETLLCSDAGTSLKPEFIFNQEIKNRYINYKTFGLKSEIITELMKEYNQDDQSGINESQPHLLQDSLLKVLSKIRINGNNANRKNGKIYSFIGPTGVGKTTTLAKLAAMNALQQGKKAALITIDTFRIAAVAQLQTYARIMGIPLEVAVDRKDLRNALKKHEDSDAIFIDTAGRSPKSDKDISDLLDLLKVPEEIHSYLVLSATTRYKNLLDIDKRFGALPFKSYIFTKLDEIDDPSTMVNFLISRQKPVSYFTTGQQVPEDIENASKKKLATLILTGMRESTNNSIGARNEC